MRVFNFINFRLELSAGTAIIVNGKIGTSPNGDKELTDVKSIEIVGKCDDVFIWRIFTII